MFPTVQARPSPQKVRARTSLPTLTALTLTPAPALASPEARCISGSQAAQLRRAGRRVLRCQYAVRQSVHLVAGKRQVPHQLTKPAGSGQAPPTEACQMRLNDVRGELASCSSTYNPRTCFAVDTQRDLITSKVKLCMSRPPAFAFSLACCQTESFRTASKKSWPSHVNATSPLA